MVESDTNGFNKKICVQTKSLLYLDYNIYTGGDDDR